ncbi:MAG TPA: tetraacyldisaccharide 4'-kinase, partial [Thermoanaerobaculia bacterium]|nr:tetraacyldisaccharide 4'-kinase [Thermoanaerobaculia bacterium]
MSAPPRPPVVAPPPSRSPWQRLYAAAHRRRAARWSARADRLAVPVWSVGNLHWGGTGKTPVVAAIAAWLHERGVAVAVLSRGYGRRGGGPLVVSAGAGPLVTPERAGDEPWLLADTLPEVPVAVAARRVDAARLLLATLPAAPQLFLLDDGFSHLELHRDLDLLVLPDDDPFGGGRLLPSGRLREPLASAARAHALLLTGEASTPERAREVGVALAVHGFAGSAFACTTQPQPPRLVRSTRAETDAATASPIASSQLAKWGERAPTVASLAAPPGPLLLVTGIARPERVRRAASAAGIAIADHLTFPDHHAYPPRSVRLIARAAAKTGAAGVLTTAKDRVKLAGILPLPLWELPVAATPEPAFWDWLAA